MDANNPL